MSNELTLAEAISAFPSNVSPSDQDQLVLTRGELERIITNAMMEVRSELDVLKEEIAKKGVTIAALESIQEQDTTRICLDIALDRQRLTSLERGSLAPKQRDHAEILRALLKDHGGKMLARDAKNMMHLSDSHFSELLAKMEDVGRKPFHLNKRQNVIFLK